MRKDYRAVLDHLNTAPRCAFPDETVFCFTDDQYYTIRHALAMMQKLEQPSEGMIGAVCEVYCESDDTGAITTAQQAIKSMLEKAEKEMQDG